MRRKLPNVVSDLPFRCFKVLPVDHLASVAGEKSGVYGEITPDTEGVIEGKRGCDLQTDPTCSQDPHPWTLIPLKSGTPDGVADRGVTNNLSRREGDVTMKLTVVPPQHLTLSEETLSRKRSYTLLSS